MLQALPSLSASARSPGTPSSSISVGAAARPRTSTQTNLSNQTRFFLSSLSFHCLTPASPFTQLLHATGASLLPLNVVSLVQTAAFLLRTLPCHRPKDGS